jgi:DNA-binding CsgD family transcriptional regulator
MPLSGLTEPTGPDIVGRALEFQAVEAFLEAATTTPTNGGRAVALFVEGEAGVGKSMLWRAAVGRASERSMDVLSCAPAAVEQALSFVALRDLIGGLPDEDFERLPPPQRRALGAALLRHTAGEAVDQGALGVALTAVLRRRADDRPVLLAIDDSQWLDPPSARVLAFALRRLGDARVGVLLTRRSGEEAPFFEEAAEFLADGADRIRLGPISFGALHHLLTIRTGHRFSRPVVARIERASGGNPMTAIEIARALLETGADEPRPGRDLPVPERLRDLLEARLARLAPRTRATLLLAAALSHPTTLLVTRAADDDADDAADGTAAREALAEAETAGIVAIEDGRVRFSHPLFASVVQAGASAAALRAVHRRLGAVVVGDEERAHHLALAATDEDADLADQLETAGSQTYHGGAPDLGADLLARARALTPAADLDARARRAVLEAEARLEAGDLAGSGAVLEAARAWMAPGPRRAEALMLLGTVQSYLDRGKAVATLELALPDAADDPTLRGRIHSRLALFADDADTSRAHGREAVALIDPAVNPSGLAFATFGLFFADVQAGAPPDLVAFDAALAIEPAVPSWEASTIPALWWKYTDRYDLARARLGRHLQWARDSGDESSDADLYAHVAELELYAGRWAEADAAATRSIEAAEQMGQVMPDPSHRIRALVDAHLGRLEQAIAAAEAGAAACQDDDDTELEAMYLDVLGAARLAAGDVGAAAEAFDRMQLLVDALGVHEPLRHRTEPDHIEALLATGAADATVRAAEVMSRLERRNVVLPRPWIAAALPRSRALVRAAGGDAEGAAVELAEALDTEAVAREPGAAREPAGAPDPAAGGGFAEARALLVLGRLERRLGHRRAAGERLDRAAVLFDALPAPAWAIQARQEIDRLGRRRGAGEDLTPAETRVVELIAAGLTNRAVAERLVLSPKTVEAHLARAYAKLGIRSRAELGRRMALGGERASEADEPAL